MSFNNSAVVNEIVEMAKKAQREQILESISKSQNQPEFDTSDLPALKTFIQNLPESQKYDVLQDPLFADMKSDLEKSTKITAEFNLKTRSNQILTIDSAINTQLTGVLKILAEELPKIILNHVANHVHEQLSMEEVQGHTHNMKKKSSS